MLVEVPYGGPGAFSCEIFMFRMFGRILLKSSIRISKYLSSILLSGYSNQTQFGLICPEPTFRVPTWNLEPTLTQFVWNPEPNRTHIFEMRMGSTSSCWPMDSQTTTYSEPRALSGIGEFSTSSEARAWSGLVQPTTLSEARGEGLLVILRPRAT